MPARLLAERMERFGLGLLVLVVLLPVVMPALLYFRSWTVCS
jgi:hypothetical protein